MANIVYFVHCYPPAVGGIEFLSGKIIQILRKEGHNVHVITGSGRTLDSYKSFSDWVDASDDSFYIHRLKLSFFWQRLANRLLNKLIFLSGTFSPWYFGPILNYDQEIIKLIKDSDLIIGAGMPTKVFYDAYSFSKKYKKKLVLIPAYHDVNYYNRCLFFQKLFDYAINVFVLTPFEKASIQKNYKVHEHKFYQTTFCPFTRSEIKKKNDSFFKRTNHIKDKKIILGFVGQITKRKNLILFKDYLDSYLSYWKEKGFTIRVLLYGAKTNSSKEIETEFNKYIISGDIEINYDFKDKIKEKIFEKIDIFINPSKEESLGIVNFEAIYYGCLLILPSKSAFASLTNKLSTYDGIEGLHKILLKTSIGSEKDKQIFIHDFDLLYKYNYDEFLKKMLKKIAIICINNKKYISST